MSKRLRRILLSITVLIGVLALAGLAFVRGWLVTRRTPTQLSALLRPFDEIVKPDGDGPFPAVIMFHGCGGRHAAEKSWARFFRDQGYVAVSVDSLGPRHLEHDWQSVCSGRKLWGRERAGDVLVSIDDVRKLPYVDGKRIVLAGWSHGGWSIMDLLALDPPHQLPTSLSAAPSGLDGVAGVILIYPYCGFGALAASDAISLRVPMLMLLSEKDTIVPTPACVAISDRWKAQGIAIDTHVYPNVDHCWDQTDLGPPLVHVPAVDADAHARIAALLARIKTQ